MRLSPWVSVSILYFKAIQRHFGCPLKLFPSEMEHNFLAATIVVVNEEYKNSMVFAYSSPVNRISLPPCQTLMMNKRIDCFLRSHYGIISPNWADWSAFLPACLPSCLPSFLPAFLPACLPSCLPSFLPAFLPACLPSCLPVCKCT